MSRATSQSPNPQSPISPSPSLPLSQSLILPLLLLLLAFALRVWNLSDIPPGLTHDEANHGREAIDILNGVLRYFFPLNYGSEPLYSYTVALSMALFGRGLLALRLVNVFFGVAAVAATYGWAAPRLGRPTALLGAALMAVSFWPLASSREALRAGMLPFLMVLAVWAFWRIVETTDDRTPARRRPTADPPAVVSGLSSVVLFALSLAATLHTYLAARVSWLVFPLFLVYLALWHRPMFRRAWRPALAGLLLGGLLAAPLFLYLRAHPEMQTRLDMLDGPLQAIAGGQWRPVLANVRDALLAFVWPGRGDQFLAYNIPGRPVFDAVSAVFFVVGLFVCLWRWRQPVYAFLLLWFLFGILPSLVTGPTANTTRNLAALPAVFLIAGVGFVGGIGRLGDWETGRVESGDWRLAGGAGWRSAVVALLAGVWLAFAGFVAARDYFVRWANMPEVRGAYQSTLAAALAHLAANYPDAEPVILSSVYPGPAHDPSIAYVLAAGRLALSQTARWVDARWALVIPPGESLVAIPDSTPPHPAYIPWLEALETVEARPTDPDPRVTLYRLDGERIAAELADGNGPSVTFNGAVELLAARWVAPATQPGATAELLTIWRIVDPARAGPIGPPTFTTDAVLFSHVLDGAGGLLTQHDSLDAPSWAWRAGDVFVQIHPLTVPQSATPGEYPTVIGFYDRASGVRLPAADGGDTAEAPPLIVAPDAGT